MTPSVPGAARRPPLVLGVARLACVFRCRTLREHELRFGRSGVVEAVCFGCGRTGYQVGLAVADDWRRAYRVGAA